MCILLSLVKSLISSPDKLGSKGERRLENKLELMDIFGYSGVCLRNVYVPKPNGTTSEIDLLYVTSKGIFVIESKYFSGYIFGDEKYKNWTVTYYAGKNLIGFSKVEKEHFYNPIWQNRSHINYLSKYLKMNIPMYSIIVFSDKCEIKDLRTQSNDFVICYQNHFRREIRSIWNYTDDVLTDDDIQKILNKLLPLTNQSSYAKQLHIDNIKTGSNDLRCPRCNGKLVIQVAQKGKYAGNRFYGCSNYPKCTYIKNI